MHLESEHRIFIMDAYEKKYLGGLEVVPGDKPGSTKMEYVSGDMRYENVFYGEKDFFGTEIVWQGDQAIWGRNYIGQLLKDEIDVDFLNKMSVLAMYDSIQRKAFYKINDDAQEFKRNVYGGWTFFRGHDVIYHRGFQVYDCFYQGGTIGLD